MFETNEQKDIIRNTIDKDCVMKDYKSKSRSLIYFGLPGGQMLDVFEWLECLETIIAVERDDDEINLILWNAYQKNINDKIQLLKGEIEDILINGYDREGIRPKKSAFDVVNLDWYSGILIKDLRGNSRKFLAIKKLFERQETANQDFRLFITISARNRDKGEINGVLNGITHELASYNMDVHNVIDWYLEKGIDQRLKIYIPYLMDQICTTYRFEMRQFLCVSYVGTGSVRMIHFTFYFSFNKEKIKPNRFNLMNLLLTPLYVIEDNKIKPSYDTPPIGKKIILEEDNSCTSS